MTENEYEKALQALGVKNVTTTRQKNNGTTMFELPLKDNFDTPLTVSEHKSCLLYTSPSPRDKRQSRMPSSA